MTFGILLHRSWKVKWLKIFFVISLLPEGTTTIACPYECLFTTPNSEAFFRSTYVRKFLHRSFEIKYYWVILLLASSFKLWSFGVYCMEPLKNDVTQRIDDGPSSPLITPCVNPLSFLLSPLLQSLSDTFFKTKFSQTKKRSIQTIFPNF